MLVDLTALGLDMAEKNERQIPTQLSDLVNYLGPDKSLDLVKLMGDAIEYIEKL